MSRELSPMPPSQIIRVALLDFIKQTDEFERYFTSSPKYTVGGLTLRVAYDPLRAIKLSHETINTALQEIGGLRVTIDATEKTPERKVHLGEWLGIDPEDPEKHLWRSGDLPPPAVLSISQRAIEEMRNEALLATN